METENSNSRSNELNELENDSGSSLPVLSWPLKCVYVVMALFFFCLAMLGVFLPGLPTTPFLLLMSFFLIRVSPRLNTWIQSWPLAGKPLREWEQKRGVRPGVKWLAYVMVLALVLFTWLYRDLNFFLKIGITVAAAIGVYVVYRLRTIRH